VEDGLEANATFVDRPTFYAGMQERCDYLAQERAQSCLEVGLRSGICLEMARTRLEKVRADLP